MDIALILLSVGPTESRSPPYMASADDARIIRASLEGDDSATEELIRRYWDQAARSALLIIGDQWLAEDAAQEAFISILGSLERFDLERPFGPWLHRIAVNKAIDRARQVAREPITSDTELRADEPRIGGDDRGAEVLEVLNRFDSVDRAILVARYVLNYRAVEIAEWLEMPASTVRVRLHRTATRVRELVGEKGDVDATDD